MECEQSKSQGRSTIRATDIEEQSHLRQWMAGTTLPNKESQGAHPGSHPGEGGRGGIQDRLEAEAEARAREIQEVERLKVEEQRAARDKHFWVDGVVGGMPPLDDMGDGGR